MELLTLTRDGQTAKVEPGSETHIRLLELGFSEEDQNQESVEAQSENIPVDETPDKIDEPLIEKPVDLQAMEKEELLDYAKTVLGESLDKRMGKSNLIAEIMALQAE